MRYLIIYQNIILRQFLASSCLYIFSKKLLSNIIYLPKFICKNLFKNIPKIVRAFCFVIVYIFFIFNVFASSPKEWQKFYEGIEGKCNEKISQYFPGEQFSKIGKIETTIQDGYLIIVFFFKMKDNINVGCIYNQKTGELDINQIL